MFVVFCHWSDGSNSVPFDEGDTREASVSSVDSSNNDVLVVFALSSDEIGGSYTSCGVTKELRRRAKMAMMSASMLDAVEGWVQASRVFMFLSTAEKYGVAYVGIHARESSHIGMRKYTWSTCVSQLLDPPDEIFAKPKADNPGADEKLLREGAWQWLIPDDIREWHCSQDRSSSRSETET